MKTRAVLLACLVIVLLACSPQFPTSGPSMTDTQVGEEPTGTSHPVALPTDSSTSSPTVASASTAAPPEATKTTYSHAASPTPVSPTTSTPSAQPELPATAAPAISPSPQADAVPTVLLVLATAEVSGQLPTYSRDDWRHWIDEDDDCQDTRHEVLLAESLTVVSYRSDRQCRVDSGE